MEELRVKLPAQNFQHETFRVNFTGQISAEKFLLNIGINGILN